MYGLARNYRLIMEVLEERGRTHAYEMKEILRDEIGHGSVYGALSAIQAKGYVTVEWSMPGEDGRPMGRPPRKYFELTAVGREALERERSRQPRPQPHGEEATEGSSR